MKNRNNGKGKAPRKQLSGTKLMKAMGSKSGAFDPEPPDQWLFILNHAKGKERLLAWVKSGTIARGHGSPYVVDEHGNAKKADRAAVELGWSVRTVWNMLAELQEEGRVQVDDDGRIYYRADVPLAHVVEEPSPDTPDQPEEDDDSDFVQSLKSVYLVEKVKALPREKFTSLKAAYTRYTKQFRPDFFAELQALGRAIDNQIEDTIFRAVGIEPQKLPARRKQLVDCLKVELVRMPDFVQSPNGDSVQTAPPGSYKPGNGSVQTAQPVQNGRFSGGADAALDPDLDKNQSSSSSLRSSPSTENSTTTLPAPSESDEIEFLAERMEFERDAAAQLLRACRKEDPRISVRVILKLAGVKQQQVFTRIRSGDIGNIAGFMIHAVPKMVHQPIRKKIEEQLASEQVCAAGGD